jgi:hypothetical protein
MGRKKKEKIQPPVTYILDVKSYSSDYSFSIGQKDDDTPYNEYRTIDIEGEIKITDSTKVRPATLVALHIMSSVTEVDPSFKPKCVGHLNYIESRVNAFVSLPPDSVQFVLSILKSGKADAVDLFGTELYRKQALVRSFRITTKFEWNDWAE